MDDGEAHRRRIFLVMSFGSVLVRGSPFDSRLVLYIVDNAQACSATLDALDCWITWSLTELAIGKWFEHSPWNEPMPHRQGMSGEDIADGWRAVVVAIQGDEKGLAKAFHFQRNWLNDNICVSCPASKVSQSPYLYTQFGD